jgi:hypothetical protein
MPPIPPEFSSLAKYHFAAESISKYNPIVGIVLRHVFAHSCGDSPSASPSAKQFLSSYSETLPSFPSDGPDEARFFANELFKSLQTYLQSGHLSPRTADQFWLCATVYSILEGDDAIEREQMCRAAAVRLQRVLAASKKKTGGAKLRRPQSVYVGGNGSEEGVDGSLMRSCVPGRKAPSVFPEPPVGKAPSEYVAQLAQLGVRIEGKVPKVSPENVAAVQEGLDTGLGLLRAGDSREALARFRAALELWGGR